MKPYYGPHNGITIYHGDCREVLPLDGISCVVTDPPYGINHQSGGGTHGKWHFVRHQGVKIHGDTEPFDPSLIVTDVPVICWGANFYSNRLPGGGWLVWDKREGIEDMQFNRSEAELAFCSELRTVKVFRHLWHGLCRASEVGEHYHPTQKPVVLMKWCLSMMPAGTVLDPYMGSGPVLIAAKSMGRRAIGIEIEERYCEIAARRLSQEVLPLGDIDSPAYPNEAPHLVGFDDV